LPKGPFIHSCIDALIHHYINAPIHGYIDVLHLKQIVYYDTFDVWHLEMYDINNCIWKYHKSMIYNSNLKALPIWRMY
jgi:hypothetical protein